MGIKGMPSKGGAERVVEAIVNDLKKDFDIYIYCSKSYSKDYQHDGMNLIKLRNLKGKHLFSFSLFLLSVFHALLFENFDLVHVHNTDAGFIIPLLRLKYRVIGTCHGFPYKRKKWSSPAKGCLKLSEIIFFRFCDMVTCVSKSLSEELNRKCARTIHYIPNGVDKCYHKEDRSLFEKYELRQKEYICFAAGRIDPTKGCHILLEAFKRIDRNIKVVVVGDFSHKKGYSEQVLLMADERTAFVPFIESKAVLFGIIKNAKVFVFPSTVEAMSMMLLEVARLGVPTICSDIAENVCVLKDYGVYFSTGNEEDLARKIEFCLDNYDEALKLSDRARMWVTKQYRWHAISERYRNIYDSQTDIP